MKIFVKIFLLFFLSLATFAHESRPVYIQIKQISENAVKIEYSVPNTVDYRNLPRLQLDKAFIKDSTKTLIKTNAQSFIIEEYFLGKIQNLKGQEISLKFPYFNPTLSSVIQIYFDKTQPESHILSPTNNVLDLRNVPKVNVQSQEFVKLGIEHIWKGIDHLLFVLCLLIIAGFGKKLFWTITGFTLAHSVTLFLSVLGLVNIPIPFVEVCIAMSIIFLCCEILRNFSGKSSLTYRFPFLVSTLFGLLHGLGFAAVLHEIGLPKDNLIQSLLFFNVGVEIGQIAFILVIYLCFWILNLFFKSLQNNTISLIKTATYFIGSLAALWFFERINAWY